MLIWDTVYIIKGLKYTYLYNGLLVVNMKDFEFSIL